MKAMNFDGAHIAGVKGLLGNNSNAQGGYISGEPIDRLRVRRSLFNDERPDKCQAGGRPSIVDEPLLLFGVQRFEKPFQIRSSRSGEIF
jgi:hypothetical protein